MAQRIVYDWASGKSPADHGLTFDGVRKTDKSRSVNLRQWVRIVSPVAYSPFGASQYKPKAGEKADREGEAPWTVAINLAEDAFKAGLQAIDDWTVAQAVANAAEWFPGLRATKDATIEQQIRMGYKGLVKPAKSEDAAGVPYPDSLRVILRPREEGKDFYTKVYQNTPDGTQKGRNVYIDRPPADAIPRRTHARVAFTIGSVFLVNVLNWGWRTSADEVLMAHRQENTGECTLGDDPSVYAFLPPAPAPAPAGYDSDYVPETDPADQPSKRVKGDPDA